MPTLKPAGIILGSTQPARQAGRLLVDFHVDDFDAAEKQLQAAGVQWVVPVADRPSGRFGTFADPDGNLLQVIQFS